MNKIKRIFTFVLPAIYVCIQLSSYLHKFRNLRDLCTNSSDDAACAILQWKGEPLVELPKENKIEATVVISYCGGEDMNEFTRYLSERSENINIREVTIISGCSSESEQSFRKNIPYTMALKSQWKDPELNFIEWLAIHVESAISRALPQYFNDENHVIVFLSSRALSSSRIRTLDEVVQSAMENRFGCVLRPQEGVSYYHLPKKLRSFKSEELEPSQTRYYSNFGEWIDTIKLTKDFDGLVPVCYSSSFAIKSRDLSQTPEKFYEVLEAMQSDYKKHEYRELIEFMERSLGAIFSLPLSEEKTLQLEKYSSSTHPSKVYSGALYHK